MKKRNVDSIALGSEDSSSDGETDDDTVQEKKTNGVHGSTEGEERTEKDDDDEAVELLLKKKVKVGKTFSEDMVCGPEGLSRIYEEFPKVFKFRGKGHEASDLNRMMRLYKEWAFQLYSGLAFPDLLRSVHTFSTKGHVRTHMAELREKERDRYMKEALGIDISAGERLKISRDNAERNERKKHKVKHISELSDEEDDSNSKRETDKDMVVPHSGFDDDVDIDMAQIEEMEKRAVLASQLSLAKDKNSHYDEEEEFDFEEAEKAMREQELAEAEAYLIEQEQVSALPSSDTCALTAQ